MKNKVKELYKTLPKDVVINNDFLLSYFKKHPKFLEKTKNGFKGFIIKKNEWNYSFHIVGDNNIFTPISYNFDVKENYNTKVNKALRTEIQPIIDKVRNQIIWGKTKCDLTGNLLHKDNTHIDHYNKDFRFVAKDFLNKYPKIKIIKKGVKFYIADENIKKEWVKFHNENTNLRAVTATANLTRSKS